MNLTRSAIPLAIFMTLGIVGCGHVGEFEPFREVSCLEAAKTSLKQAITAAEATGGRTLDADYRQDDEMGCIKGNAGVYDVTLLSNGTIDVVSVDASSGKVGPRVSAGVMNALLAGGRFEGSPANMARMAPKLSMRAVEAVDIAEQQGGKAMVAWIDEKDGQPGYIVKLVQHGRVRAVWIDGL
jgi:uncharacterized membrane protein YkoI